MLIPWHDDRSMLRTLAVVDEMRRRMDRVFSDLDGRIGRTPGIRSALRDAGDDLVFEAELPGVDAKDLDLTVQQDVLTLTAKREAPVPEGYRVHRRERDAATFAESFTLPCRVDLEKTSARLEDGVLTVRMAKSPESRPRRIAVSA